MRPSDAHGPDQGAKSEPKESPYPRSLQPASNKGLARWGLGSAKRTAATQIYPKTPLLLHAAPQPQGAKGDKSWKTVGQIISPTVHALIMNQQGGPGNFHNSSPALSGTYFPYSPYDQRSATAKSSKLSHFSKLFNSGWPRVSEQIVFQRCLKRLARLTWAVTCIDPSSPASMETAPM